MASGVGLSVGWWQLTRSFLASGEGKRTRHPHSPLVSDYREVLGFLSGQEVEGSCSVLKCETDGPSSPAEGPTSGRDRVWSIDPKINVF